MGSGSFFKRTEFKIFVPWSKKIRNRRIVQNYNWSNALVRVGQDCVGYINTNLHCLLSTVDQSADHQFFDQSSSINCHFNLSVITKWCRGEGQLCFGILGGKTTTTASHTPEMWLVIAMWLQLMLFSIKLQEQGTSEFNMALIRKSTRQLLSNS